MISAAIRAVCAAIFILVSLQSFRLGYLFISEEIVYDSESSRPLPKFANQSEGLVQFIHVSDIHVSIFQDPDRTVDLERLCNGVINRVIAPSAVIITGDLTDAKTKDRIGSTQYEEEWVLYRRTLEKCGTKIHDSGDSNSKTKWLDIKGNHDTFNLGSHTRDQFRIFGVSGGGGVNSNDVVKTTMIQENGAKIALVAIDATLNPGPKRPFNFFGSVTGDELTKIQSVLAGNSNKADAQIIYGHYPISCVASPDPGFKTTLVQSARNGVAYLCGHLHTLAGYVPKLYSKHGGRLLELEVGDWKDNRIFRHIVIDQGDLSFEDYHFRTMDSSSIVMVTNPKAVSLISSQSEFKVYMYLKN